MARKRQRTIYLGDSERWRIVRANLPGLYGLCDYASHTISIHQTLNGVELMDTLIHEIIHARWPDLSEAAVIDISETLSGVLDNEGFKQPDDHED